MVARYQPRKFFSPKFTCFHHFWRKKIRELWLQSAVNFVPEIVAGTIIYQIEALFELYKWRRANPANAIFKAKIHLFSSDLEEKNQKTVTEYGHNSWSRNRCWGYNIPNRSNFWALQMRLGVLRKRNFFGQNSLVFISFGEKNRRIMAEVGHNICSRNRCWDYNIPNWSSFRAPQKGRGEIRQPNFLGQNSLVFIRFWGKNEKNSDWIRP